MNIKKLLIVCLTLGFLPTTQGMELVAHEHQRKSLASLKFSGGMPILKKNCQKIREKYTQNLLKKYKKPESFSLAHLVKQLPQDIALAYGIAMATTFVHELGHATVAKLAGAESITINMGSTNFTSPILFTLPGFALRGFNPIAGFYSSTFSFNPSPLTKIAISSAGPVAGILCATGIAIYLYKKYPRPETYLISKKVAGAILLGNILQTTPYSGTDTDGAQIHNAYQQWRAGK